MPTTAQPVAIITGAGSGVGRALALQLTGRGYRCALAGRTPLALEQTAAQCRAQTPGAELLIVPTDVADPPAARALVEKTAGHLGRIDALANVAGNAPLQPIPEITDAALRDCLAINFESVVTLTRACWPVFERQGGGVVVNVSSMASLDPFTGFNLYGAAKAATNLFTRATADEGQALGVRAYAIAPGAIETGMLRSLFDEDMLPKDQTLSPDAVAQVITECVTGETAISNGQTFVLDSPPPVEQSV